jgi:hypothetical protein
LGRHKDWVSGRRNEGLGLADTVPEPLPSYADVDSPDLSFEGFFYLDHAPGDHTPEVDHERQAYIEEKADPHGVIAARVARKRVTDMRVPIIAALAATVVAITGCTGDNGAGATPSTGASSSTATSPPASSQDIRSTSAPEVTDPVDLRSFYTKPCATLTPRQQRQVGFYQYDPVDHESHNSQFGVCVWRHNPQPATDANYGYRLMLHVSGDPLAEAYATSDDRDTWSVFEPRQIRDLPAVVRSLSTPDDQCEVIVGTGNGQGITISGTITASDPTLCERFTTAAERVISAARG